MANGHCEMAGFLKWQNVHINRDILFELSRLGENESVVHGLNGGCRNNIENVNSTANDVGAHRPVSS